ncbi:MAG: hypothetical protein VX460_15090 [Planctomycetota bacterium]|nr:hypothetical protein [Planctomycetota bacterium]
MTRSDSVQTSDGRAPWGLIAALPVELGPFRGAGRGEVVGGVRLSFHQIPDGPPLLAAVAGVGKVAAAHAAATLVARGVQGLLVVGTCGGLDAVDEVGTLVHAEKAVQWDLGVREGRVLVPDPALAAAWQEEAPGQLRTFLTADRAALGQLQRARRARAVRRSGDPTPVADMETAAVAAVAVRAGLPWAALRVVSDQRLRLRDRLTSRGRSRGRFQDHLETVAGRPAETVAALLRARDRGNR